MKEKKSMMRGLLVAVALLIVIDCFGYTLLLTNDCDGVAITVNAVNRIIISTIGEEGYEACIQELKRDTTKGAPHKMIAKISYDKCGFHILVFLKQEKIIAQTLGDPFFKQKILDNLNSQIDTVYGFIEPECFLFNYDESKSVREKQIESWTNHGKFYLNAIPPYPQLENDTTDDYHIDFQKVWQIIDRRDKIKVKYFK